MGKRSQLKDELLKERAGRRRRSR